MRCREGLLLVGLAAMLASAVPAYAGPNANSKILIHLASPTSKNACGRAIATPTCSQIETEAELAPASHFAYLLVVDADSTLGVAGVQCGVSYNPVPSLGVDVHSWTNCATLEFPSDNWPAAGGGNLVTWDATTRCQRYEPDGFGSGVVAVAGYFYCTAYTPDALTVIPRRSDLEAKVAACDATVELIQSATVQYAPSHLGYASFSPGRLIPGHNPCEGAEAAGAGPGPGSSTASITVHREVFAFISEGTLQFPPGTTSTTLNNVSISSSGIANTLAAYNVELLTPA